jgi:(E)-4-hydroxy-3-methyl-but-2-enyl pyrophosphate reductase
MEVEIAQYSGYCFGVKRALKIVEKTLEENSGPGQNIYTLGSVIHNPGVMKELTNMGLISVNNPENIKQGSILIIRSHGMSPRVLNDLLRKNIEIIDATCPFVKKAQAKVKKLESQGYFVLVIGNRDHPEVIGIKEQLDDSNVKVIENSIEASGLDYKKKIGVVIQTTQTADRVKSITSVLIDKCKELLICNTICDTTKNRQESTKILSKKVDVMVIAGGKNSANTTHLADISLGENKRTYHIESSNEIDPEWFRDSDKIGISGGASTPEKDIIDIKKVIESIDS